MEEFKQKNDIFSIQNEDSFYNTALKIFRFQACTNPVYNFFLTILQIRTDDISSIFEIPFLPIEVYKTNKVLCDNSEAKMIFRSSRTTGQIPSSHYVADLSIYDKSLLSGFEKKFGPPSSYTFLALLPSYIERPDSSLVYMLEQLMKASGKPDNGFYLYDTDSLQDKIRELKEKKQRFILWGVSFALLELAQKTEIDFGGNIVLETGGMKGREKEIIKDEFYQLLRTRFHNAEIYSEYGMTELLSQAYSADDGKFRCPPWMKVFTRDIHDPRTLLGPGENGAINIIDLANLYSCSFIATQDLGRTHADGSFEVTGRMDGSEWRGCNMLLDMGAE